ncbi:MAG: hypothetical protein ACI87E_002760 [Mariniblastus sp.]
MGLGGVAILVHAFGQFPKPIVWGAGGFLGLIVVLVCGSTFLAVSKMLPNFRNSNPVAQTEASQRANELRQEARDERAKQQTELFKQENKEVDKMFDQAEAMQKAMKDSFNQEFGVDLDEVGARGDSNRGKQGDDPFAQSDSNLQSKATTGDSSSDVASAENPFAGGVATNDPIGDSADLGNVNPFKMKTDASPDETKSPRTSSFGSGIQKRMELSKRDMRQGMPVMQFKAAGFPDINIRLDFGKLIGQERPMGQVYAENSPMNGVLFWRESLTFFMPSLPGDTDASVTAAKAGEVLHGLNLNFEDGSVAGIQAIFRPTPSNSEGSNEDEVEQTTGD